MKRNRTYRITVSGKGNFPLDMLRYDQCWPRDSADAARIVPELPISAHEEFGFWADPRIVTLLSNKHPTEHRWLSFGWACTYEEAE